MNTTAYLIMLHGDPHFEFLATTAADDDDAEDAAGAGKESHVHPPRRAAYS